MQRKGSGKIFGKKKAKGKGNEDPGDRPTIHRRNIRIAAYPLVILFNIIRSIAFQLWILLTFVCRTSSRALPLKTKLNRAGEENLKHPIDMASAKRPGSGDPALVRQKYHHRKAFEYISKALKVDEEDKGRNFVNKYQLHLQQYNSIPGMGSFEGKPLSFVSDLVRVVLLFKMTAGKLL